MPTDSGIKSIVERTLTALADMDRASTLGELDQVFRDWTRFADASGVAPQIKQHLADKRRTLAQRLPVRSPVAD